MRGFGVRGKLRSGLNPPLSFRLRPHPLPERGEPPGQRLAHLRVGRHPRRFRRLHSPGASRPPVFLRIGALQQKPQDRVRRLDLDPRDLAVADHHLRHALDRALPGDGLELGRRHRQRRLDLGLEVRPFNPMPPHRVARYPRLSRRIAEAARPAQRLEESALLLRRETVVPLPVRLHPRNALLVHPASPNPICPSRQ